MPTMEQIKQREMDFRSKDKDQYYTGPTTYRGEQINQKHSISRVVNTLLRLLMKTQFASINVVGIPGSGKTTFAVNLFEDLIAKAYKLHKVHFSFEWWDADDLRNLGEKIHELPKGENHIRVCDDVSKALEGLPTKEQAEIFQQLTTTRHTTGGRLCLGSLYHYTYANLKSVKSQSIVNVYTSISLIEKQNIQAMLGKDPNSLQKLNSYMRIYQSSIDKDEYPLKTYPGQDPPKTFYDWKPFHPCFVINLFKAHIALFQRVDESPLWPKGKLKYSIPVNEIFEKGRKAYGRDFDHAMRILAAQNNYFNNDNVNFGRAYNYAQKLKRKYNWNWQEVMNTFKAKQLKRIQKNRKIEKDMDKAFSQLAKMTKDEPEVIPDILENDNQK